MADLVWLIGAKGMPAVSDDLVGINQHPGQQSGHVGQILMVQL